MVKFVGAVLVLVSAYAMGSLLALQVKEQEHWLRDIKTAMFLLLGELEYRQVPLPDALQIIGKRHGGRLAPFFQNLSSELLKKEGVPLQELWKKTSVSALKDCPLKEDQKEAFEELGIYFTETDKETRRNSLDFYLSRLEEDIVKLRETGADKAYLCRTLGMLGGIFLLILVL
jgi:stage III sporulation protein AB